VLEYAKNSEGDRCMRIKMIRIFLSCFLCINLSGCALQRECEFFLCRRNAVFMRSYCSTHQNTMDLIDDIIGIFD